MFETAITPAAAVPGALRTLDWAELVARFAAARDVRNMFARRLPGAGSFADRAARGLPRSDQGKRAVNHDALGRGKTPAAKSVATAEEAAVGNQGTQ